MIKSAVDIGLANGAAKRGSLGIAPIAICGLIALAALWLWVSRTLLPGELIRPLSPDLMAAAVFVGVFCSLLLAARVMKVKARLYDERPSRRLDAVVGVLILPTLVASASLRTLVQAGAFVGVTPQVTNAQFMIEGFRTSHGTHLLRVRLGQGGREFSVPVRTALYDAAQKGDTVTLSVETGRYGIQRAMVLVGAPDAALHHHSKATSAYFVGPDR